MDGVEVPEPGGVVVEIVGCVVGEVEQEKGDDDAEDQGEGGEGKDPDLL